MNLKKINPNLQEALIENSLTAANEMQEETFSAIKSGADCIVIAPEGSVSEEEMMGGDEQGH